MNGEFIHWVENEVAFNRFLGLKVDEAAEGRARLRLPYRDEFVGDARRPALHGGVVSFLVDTCGGVAAWSLCAPGDRLSTIDMRVDYLRPAPPAELTAEGEVGRLGNRVAVVHVVVRAAGSREVVAEGRGVYNVRKGPR